MRAVRLGILPLRFSGLFRRVHFLVCQIDIIIQSQNRILSDHPANAGFNGKAHTAISREHLQGSLKSLRELLHLQFVRIGNHAYEFVSAIAHGNGLRRTALPQDGSNAADGKISHIMTEVVVDIF